MSKRPVVMLDGGDLHTWADETWAAIVAANDPREPTVMLHGNDLVRLSDKKLAPYNADSLRERTSRVASFARTDAESERKAKPPPPDVAKVLIAREANEYPDAARIERITDVPIVKQDRSVLASPGYDEDARTYYLPAEGLEGLEVAAPDTVNEVDTVVEAREFLLEEWLGEFGFKDEASRANALAMLLTPFVRDLIDGGTPLFPMIAPQWGWGKGLLTDMCLLPGCGSVGKTPGTDSEEEMRKRITSALRSVPPAVVMDNLTGHLDSGNLALALTTGEWKDRLLGESRDLEVPQRCVWTANGNNFTLSGELVERSPAPILLGPGDYWYALCERKGWDSSLRPRERPRSQYTHEYLLKWGKENRARAVQAAFVLIRHWLDGPAEVVEGGHRFYRPALDEGLPEDERRVAPELPDRDTGEFPEWQRVVGGILKAADVPGFADNYLSWSTTTDPEGEENAAFLEAWHALGREPLAFKEGLLPLCEFGGDLHDHLPTELAEVPGGKLHGKMKAWLRDHKDQRYGGFRLIGEGEGRDRRWKVLGG